MGDIFKKLFWQNICKMLFFLRLPGVPPSQCLVALILDDGRNIWTLTLQGHVRDTLELQGLRWFSSKWISRPGNKKKQNAPGETGETFWEERSTVVKEHNRSASSSRPPLLPSHGRSERPLPSCYVSFISTLWFSLESKHRLSISICTLYILYLKPVGPCTFPLGLTETSECLCTVLSTVMHLCCTRAWWGPGDAD